MITIVGITKVYNLGWIKRNWLFYVSASFHRFLLHIFLLFFSTLDCFSMSKPMVVAFFFIFLERQRVSKSWYWNRITKKKMVMFKGVVDRTALFYCKIYIGWRTVDSKRSYQLFFFFLQTQDGTKLCISFCVKVPTCACSSFYFYFHFFLFFRER